MSKFELKSSDIWYSVFRPKMLGGMILPKAYKTAFEQYISEGSIPTMLIHSHTPGTGKTTLAKIFTHTLNADYLFINLSLNRGIDVLREDIMEFISVKSLTNKNAIKVIHLDEADGATPDFQRALRACIEEYSSHARFILTCNYPHMLIEPLIKRCVVYDFNFLRNDHREEMIPEAQRLYKMVLGAIEVKFDPEAVDLLVRKMFPNMRDIFNHLQRQVNNHGLVDMGVIEGVAGHEDVFNAILKADWNGMWDVITNNGIDPKSLYSVLFQSFIPTLPPQLRATSIEIVEKYMANSATSSDPQLTFAACAVVLMKIIAKHKVANPNDFK